jgi:hypothetical protein
MAEPKVDRGSVRFCSLVDDEHGFTASFMRSFLPTLALDLGGQQRIWRGGYAFQQCTSAGVVEGRNEAVKAFLESAAEWLWFVDSDMGWDPEALEQLMAVADPVERPIVGGLCFGFGPISDRIDHAQAVIKKPFPTIFDLAETDDDVGFRPRWGYLPNVVQRCDATGAAMLLIHRSVFERMAAESTGAWFDRIRHPKAKKLWGEDTSFCARARLLDIPVYVHAGVRTSHSKVVFVTETQFMAELMAPPASDRVDVLVPVLNRPQNAEPFMRSLRASTGLASVSVACNNEADQKAWLDAGASRVIMSPNRTTFAEKINDLYSSSPWAVTSPWVFIVGDDVRFHPGWLDHAQHIGQHADVVGTNDLGNARVTAGEHATHLLIKRSYIDEQGASWDGPGVVCHEGYRHWFVDDEIVTAAKQRGVWGMSLASVVEHLHPIWGKSEDDDTYRLGQRHQAADGKLFRKRLHHEQAVAAA